MLELAVKLPAALPLRPPELECRRKVGGVALGESKLVGLTAMTCCTVVF